MVTSSPEFPKKSLQIKQDDKFFSRKVSRENSMANPSSSFRVYYGGVTGAIPFTWEIQPGTPKHKFSDTSLPPLTPPPSYYSNTPHHDKPTKKTSRSKIFSTFFFKISLKKASGHVSSHSPPSSSQSLSSSWSSSHSSLAFPNTPNSSSSSSSSSSSRTSGSRRRFLSFGSSFDDGMDDGHVYVGSSSPTSVYCFGISRRMIRI